MKEFYRDLLALIGLSFIVTFVKKKINNIRFDHVFQRKQRNTQHVLFEHAKQFNR